MCSFSVHLRCAGQDEQQVEGRLGEVKVAFGSQAELHCAEDGGEHRDLLHHGDPVLTVLIGSTQFLGQVQRQNTHLITKVKVSLIHTDNISVYCARNVCVKRFKNKGGLSELPTVVCVPESTVFDRFCSRLTPSLWSFCELRGESVSMLSSSSPPSHWFR